MGVLTTDINEVTPWMGFKLQIIENTVAHYIHQEQYCYDTGVRLGKPEMHTSCNQTNHWADILSDVADITKYIRNVIYDLCGSPCILQEVDDGRWCAIPVNPVQKYDNEIIYSYEIMIVAKQ